jgi:hypothetical protein
LKIDLNLHVNAVHEAALQTIVSGKHLFCPLDTPPEAGPRVVLRLEDERGFGPFAAVHGYDDSEHGRHFLGYHDVRWGVTNFGRYLTSDRARLGTGFHLVAYLVDEFVDRGWEVVFRLGQSARLGCASEQVGEAPVLVADRMAKIDGAMGGTDGGVFRSSKGELVYLKLHRSTAHAQQEALASALYREAGVEVFPLQLATRDGRLGTASAWQGGFAPILPGRPCPDAWDGFAVDSWLVNWDVAGGAFRNLLRTDSGSIIRTDVGGALGFRALGAPKVFGPEVRELRTMLDPAINPSAATVFAGIDDAAIRSGVEKIASVKPERIRELVSIHGLGDGLAGILIARRAFLMGAV